jgi:hypothetical protein
MGERSSSRKKKTGQADKIRSSRWGSGDRTLLHPPNQLAELGSEQRKIEIEAEAEAEAEAETETEQRCLMFGILEIKRVGR